MKRILLLTAALLLTALLRAQDYGQSATITLWDNASAPHSNGIEASESEQNTALPTRVTEARLYLFPADTTKATGLAVVICPGGGYSRLAINHEGHRLAQWFAAHGITAAVLQYRMPDGHPEVPFEDAEHALRIMMGLEAGATGFTPDRVGIVGSSAGGHLAAAISTMAATKPAFSILFYPVITGEESKCRKNSFDNLLGANRTREQTERYSLENRVTEQTPPALLLLSDDDRVVLPANSIRYYDALKEHGIEASMHIYPSGGHGWVMRDEFRYEEQWQETVLDWLKLRTHHKPNSHNP